MTDFNLQSDGPLLAIYTTWLGIRVLTNEENRIRDAITPFTKRFGPGTDLHESSPVTFLMHHTHQKYRTTSPETHSQFKDIDAPGYGGALPGTARDGSIFHVLCPRGHPVDTESDWDLWRRSVVAPAVLRPK